MIKANNSLLRALIAGGVLAAAVLPLQAKIPFVKAQSAQGLIIDAMPGQVLVRYKPGRSAKVRPQILETTGTKTLRTIKSLDIDVLRVPSGETIDSFISRLKNNSDIEFAEPNGVIRPLTPVATPNDPYVSSQYNLSKIELYDAWSITPGSTSTVVAVVDTGVNYNHRDLAAHMWVNPFPAGNSGLHGTTIEIDPGDGCTDVANGGQCPSDDPMDDVGHGTMVAGIIGAVSNNGLDIAGVANCQLMAVKALGPGGGSDESVANGMIYAADNGASIINLSLGGAGESGTLKAAVNYALGKNVVVVAAAGNSPTVISYPAAFEGVISVGATDAFDQIASFSYRGPTVDLVAPGYQLRSTSLNGATDIESGTSFASPMVAGVAALIRSLFPTMPVRELTQVLDYNSDDLGATGFDPTYGFGRLNAYKALAAAQAGTAYVSNPAYPNDTFPAPNPFHPSQGGNVNFFLPSGLGAENLTIKIYDTAGVLVKTLNDTLSWDGKNDSGNFVGSGLYFYYVATSAGHAKGKLTVVK